MDVMDIIFVYYYFYDVFMWVLSCILYVTAEQQIVLGDIINYICPRIRFRFILLMFNIFTV